jgi:hypothetical protein
MITSSIITAATQSVDLMIKRISCAADWPAIGLMSVTADISQLLNLNSVFTLSHLSKPAPSTVCSIFFPFFSSFFFSGSAVCSTLASVADITTDFDAFMLYEYFS